MGHPIRDVDLRAAAAECGGVADLVIVHLPFTVARTGVLLAVRPDLSAGTARSNAGASFQVYSGSAGPDRCSGNGGAGAACCIAMYPSSRTPVGRLRDSRRQ